MASQELEQRPIQGRYLGILRAEARLARTARKLGQEVGPPPKVEAMEAAKIFEYTLSIFVI